MHQALRIRCDQAALISNYRALRNVAGVATGAAVKADAYGLGAEQAVRALLETGCRDFFVSTWWEAATIGALPAETLAVLHGFGPDDEPIEGVRPVLVTAQQVARWKTSARAGAPCDVMVDTGMNRLGLAMADLPLLEGLQIHTLHSHLACADEDHPLNHTQLERFREIRANVVARRYSLANSAGVLLGRDYAFDLVRPGLGLYGGIPRPEGRDLLKQVAIPQAQVIQLRKVAAGETIGYNATYTARADCRVAVINLGYADGYARAFSGIGRAFHDGAALPVLGRVSMDLVTLGADSSPELREGDWVDLDFALEEAAALSGRSQYELLTGLGRRFRRDWT